MKTQTRRRIDGDVQAAIERYALEGWGAAQIGKKLRPPNGDFVDVPTDRTIQRIVNEVAPPNRSGDWSLMASEPEHVAAGLDMLAAWAELNRTGKPSVVSIALVETAALIRNGRTGIPRELEWSIATLYVGMVAADRDTSAIDQFLAYEPWRGWEERLAYFTAVHERRITAAPVFLLTTALNDSPGVLLRFLLECQERDVGLANSAVLREQIPAFAFGEVVIDEGNADGHP